MFYQYREWFLRSSPSALYSSRSADPNSEYIRLHCPTPDDALLGARRFQSKYALIGQREHSKSDQYSSVKIEFTDRGCRWRNALAQVHTVSDLKQRLLSTGERTPPCMSVPSSNDKPQTMTDVVPEFQQRRLLGLGVDRSRNELEKRSKG